MKRSTIRRLALLMVVMVVGIVMFFLVRAIADQVSSRKLREVSTPLPDFTFHRLGAGNFSRKDLAEDKAVAVFFMHPECDHCQSEAAELSRNLALFDSAEVMLVSTAPMAAIRAFAEDYGLLGHENLYVLHDSAFQFDTWFGESPFPTAIAYDRKHLLQGHYTGGAKMELIRAKMGE